MRNYVREQIALIEAEFAGYQCWHIPCAQPPDTWCAKRHDGRGKLINTDSADELRQAIADEVDELAAQDRPHRHGNAECTNRWCAPGSTSNEGWLA